MVTAGRIKLWRTFGDIIEENDDAVNMNIDVTSWRKNWVTSRRKDSDVIEERW